MNKKCQPTSPYLVFRLTSHPHRHALGCSVCHGSHPLLIFGGASIGYAYDRPEAVSELLRTLRSLGITRVDTAARYPPTNPGASERLLGEAGAATQGFDLDTKILCWGDGSGTLEPAAIEKSLHESRRRLQSKGLLEEQAAGLNAQYKRGLFNKLGVSNLSPEMLSEFLGICDDKGFDRPSVYQGQYNLIFRGIETTLFPTLRKHGMTLNAYSPLAGGFLSGRLSAGETEGTRFAEGNIMSHKTIEPLAISNIEASMRWISSHSALGPDDGVILGASKPSQLERNLEGIAKHKTLNLSPESQQWESPNLQLQHQPCNCSGRACKQWDNREIARRKGTLLDFVFLSDAT
ncbi:aldo/keto reductase family protein [Hirsutella rhossiliensis]|uniref:Aldo/keto reductase family domain-containing protein n=1 Tax=Hirsutella rhossiliensis TaxID=111463 RepID=A0A9P8MMY8_9HYPO|nr:aldo/keto reductase family domain-containing protein [Hirsutella rhossiliensis]KAH0958035.1 aldo/keto reductase family domain-containing protein [Hirsutella rhossiliensis]